LLPGSSSRAREFFLSLSTIKSFAPTFAVARIRLT
jgi:hypothetical protein